MPHIVAVQSAFPKYRFDQEWLTEAYIRYVNDPSLNTKVLRRMHQSVGVKGRHFAMPEESYAKLRGFREHNAAFCELALSLSQECLESLFSQAEITAAEISALYFTTVTGIAVPSIDARLMNRMPFAPNLKRVPMFGLGCGAGAAGISRVHDYLKGFPAEAAVLHSVELCSLTVQRQDFSVANMISSGLFGDGSASVLLVGDEHPFAKKSQLKILGTESIFFPKTEGVMGWDLTDNGFKIILTADVPKVAEEKMPPFVDAGLAKYGLKRQDIAVWVSHPGGPKVIDSLERGLDLPAGSLDVSRQCLADVGNLSSASVLVILERTLETTRPKKGSFGVILAMGPGFFAELVLVQW